MKLKTLVGSGDKIILFVLPFLAVGLALNLWRPAWFSVGGPPPLLAAVSVALLALGLLAWLWSVALILIEVPRGRLITSGPFALVKHPIYTGISLLALPSAGFLLNSWLGVPLGVIMYVASRRFAPEEEKRLADAFGPAWDAYRDRVLIPWL